MSPILRRHISENLPCPLFAKEGKFLPFAKGGKEGLEGRCLDIMDCPVIQKKFLECEFVAK
jgi:hypothetical protein